MTSTLTEPHTITGANHPETSFGAARSIMPISGDVRRQVYEFIKSSTDGATCDEVEQATQLRHQTVSARIRELSDGGYIHDPGLRRTTRSGRPAIVWRVFLKEEHGRETA